MNKLHPVLAKASRWESLSDGEALSLADHGDTSALASVAAQWRDAGFRNVVTYSRKIFIPLTHLCRDVCHYCTFAQVPRKLKAPYMSVDEVLDIAHHGAALGCKEALFTLGEKPELRYKAAREGLEALGFETTLDYLEHVAEAVLNETGLLPHLNPGNMTPEELDRLRRISPSMGIMLESTSERLCEKGMPHYGSPDKVPAVRLQTLADAGKARIPFTTGILIGIGETRRERIESLLAIRAIHAEYGHIQEIIVQNFRAKPETKMARAPEPDLEELLWTIAMARLIFGPEMSVQAPPNLSPGVLPQIVAAGINDWGGVSPLTPDFVNPEAPWPHLDELARETALAGKHLHERLTVYPDYARDLESWVAPELHQRLLDLVDAEGFPRTDDWSPGEQIEPREQDLQAIRTPPAGVSADVRAILEAASAGEDLAEADVGRPFPAPGDGFPPGTPAAPAPPASAHGGPVRLLV
ncbi:MAG: 7,8-didemethyl-8-hydroxy-5-deazariboflavin synthase CofG, partial [Gammaproteobacteria bacterium]|nr:7,8-didemethyl-8-hydroxy-5-deazariboflavin synthase CofG [Gammaproteobacteria bacterium]